MFRIKYSLKHTCTGKCKFSNGIEEILFTPPFLELFEIHINDSNIKTIDDFIVKGYFKDRNVLCKEEICVSENVDSVQTFKYNIIELPLILSVYISMNEDGLKLNRKKIINLLVNDFVLGNRNYLLKGIIIMPSINHFTVLFKNNSELLGLNKCSWYYHDDINGLIKSINDLGFKNIIESNNLCLFIYKKNRISISLIIIYLCIFKKNKFIIFIFEFHNKSIYDNISLRLNLDEVKNLSIIVFKNYMLNYVLKNY